MFIHLVLFLGNPGLASYYEDFMMSLKSKLPDEYSIWTLGHGGHDIPKDYENFPKLSENRNLFSLEAVIQQKIEFIQNNTDSDQEITLIGHSIGSKMVLEVMNSKVRNFQQGCLLFPTFQNMITSPAGKKLKHSVKYFPTLLQMALTWMISLLPRVILAKLIKFWLELTATPCLTDACLDATLDLINPQIISHILHLADTELKTVLDPDYDQIRSLKDKLWLYYGVGDQWVPLEYYENLKKNIPDIDAEVCDKGIKHAFVLSSSAETADIVAAKILNKNS